MTSPDHNTPQPPPSPPSAAPAPPAPPSPPVPLRMHLDRHRHLEITWAAGERSIYPLETLRSQCPCATCKKFREEQATRKSLLNLLPGNYGSQLRVEKAELVGNYAIQLHWSDQHASGIYSWEYLYSIRPEGEGK